MTAPDEVARPPGAPRDGTITVIGEALIDVVHRPGEPAGSAEEFPGGSPANVALGLGRLGRMPRLLTALGDDARGHLLRAHLAPSGVEVVDLGGSARTATSTAWLREDGSARYDFDLSWRPDAGRATWEPAPAWVHTGSIAAVLEPGASEVLRLIRRWRERAVVSFDPNARPSLIPDPAAARERIGQLAALSDVVKASDEDLEFLAPGRDPQETASQWLASGASLVCVTFGGEGSLVLTADGDRVEVPAAAVMVQDTVGAGDTFMAALIDALAAHAPDPAVLRSAGPGAAGWSRPVVEAAARRASLAAGITVARRGADLPWAQELAAATAP
ncbi:carbohydrate kinase family protein [Sediminivirga luteola]|uniref:carbohydrate kinase family protein n=1 Tax=Sediminivirga luteola TaxID=1774748 RepID=UPI001F581CF6|nr:carbohydrate kinase [Sediminivirga luteola]MCI2265087.1 carbohydrate kinase [Sediminivirga luteola]